MDKYGRQQWERAVAKEREGTCQWKSQIIAAVAGEVLWHILSQRLIILMFCISITMTVKMKNLCFVLCIDSYLPKCCKGETYILFIDWSEVKVAQSCATPWTIQSMEFSRPEYWRAFCFSRGSFQYKDWIQISCITGRFFTSWATKEAQMLKSSRHLIFRRGKIQIAGSNDRWCHIFISSLVYLLFCKGLNHSTT